MCRRASSRCADHSHLSHRGLKGGYAYATSFFFTIYSEAHCVQFVMDKAHDIMQTTDTEEAERETGRLKHGGPWCHGWYSVSSMRALKASRPNETSKDFLELIIMMQ